MACQFKPFPESAEQVAQRLGRNPRAVFNFLYRMSQKGFILRIRFNGVRNTSWLSMFVVVFPDFS